MNEQSPICQKCPISNACLLEKNAEKLAEAIIRDVISDEGARGQLSTLNKVSHNYNCPPEEKERLVVPLKKRVLRNRGEINITPSQTTPADMYEIDRHSNIRDKSKHIREFHRRRRTEGR